MHLGGGSPDLYKHLVKKYPDAHYILSTRDSHEFLKSFKKLIKIFDQDEKTAMSSMYSLMACLARSSGFEEFLTLRN